MAYTCKIFETVNTAWALVFYMYTHVCTISKDDGINKEEEKCVPNKESKSGHRFENKYGSKI